VTLRNTITHLRAQPQDALYYIQGVLRYALYRNPRLRFLLRWHILAQYEERKKLAQPCYFAGECRCCGCDTPQLFFADKPCSAGKKAFPLCAGQTRCYGPMLSQTDFSRSRIGFPLKS